MTMKKRIKELESTLAGLNTDAIISEELARFGITTGALTGEGADAHINRPVPKADARLLCDALAGRGLVASWAPDNDDGSQAWVYVREVVTADEWSRRHTETRAHGAWDRRSRG